MHDPMKSPFIWTGELKEKKIKIKIKSKVLLTVEVDTLNKLSFEGQNRNLITGKN